VSGQLYYTVQNGQGPYEGYKNYDWSGSDSAKVRLDFLNYYRATIFHRRVIHSSPPTGLVIHWESASQDNMESFSFPVEVQQNFDIQFGDTPLPNWSWELSNVLMFYKVQTKSTTSSIVAAETHL
jgi:hypothetical protein